MGHVLSLVSWVQCHRDTVPSWVFHGSKIFSREYFVGLKFFLVGISLNQNFLSWVFCGSEIFSRGYFVGLKFSGGYSWVRNFLSRAFRGSELFSREYFVGPSFFLVVDFLIQRFKELLAAQARVIKTIIQKYISNHVFFSKLISTIVNCFYQKSASSTKLLTVLRSFHLQ